MTGKLYDIIPYTSYAYSQTHPEHLYTIARLFGLKTAYYGNARILELGCAGGWNIIPMAFNLPNSEFLGIDLSEEHVKGAKQHLKELDLNNISIRQESILNFSEKGMFDYIICHGVFTWTPKNVQKKIFSICRNHLSSQGVAYISYNTLPGWNNIKSLRDMMAYHTKQFETFEEKAEQARSMLQFVLESLGDQEKAYGDFINQEIEILKDRSDSYLLHDHLEENNIPMYFHEFIDFANHYNLSYLADVPISLMYPNNFSDTITSKLNEIQDIIRTNQYMDFLRNQRFKATLLCQKEDSDKYITRELESNDIEKFYISYGAIEQDLENIYVEDDTIISFANNALTISVQDKISKIAMLWLVEQQGKPVSYKSLCEHVLSHINTENYENVRMHLNKNLNLMRLLFGGLIGIHSESGNYTLEVSDKPKTTELARFQAAKDIAVTNQRHENIAFNFLDRILIQYLDGKHSSETIIQNLIQLVNGGEIEFISENDKKIEMKDIPQNIEEIYKESLSRYAKEALLIE